MIPRLIHPVDVKIKQLKRPLEKDPDTQQPTKVYYKEVELRGQVEWRNSHALQVGEGGLIPVSNGHIIFLERTLKIKRISLRMNDVITEVDGEMPEDDEGNPVELLIVDVPPRAHYKHKTMRKAVFKYRARGI